MPLSSCLIVIERLAMNFFLKLFTVNRSIMTQILEPTDTLHQVVDPMSLLATWFITYLNQENSRFKSIHELNDLIFFNL